MADKFHRAARDGYLDPLRDANRRDMNTTDEDGRTPAMLAAQYGNLDALRIIIMRGGNVNMTDLIGNSPLHHACRNGHMNCVTYLVNYGANFWVMDNDFHTPLDVAALENREDIVKFLDEAQTMQQRKNPKFVQTQKEKALKDAERNIKSYEKVQEKASKEMEKSRRKMEREESIQNGDFKAPSSNSFVKTLTLRIKGVGTKSKAKGTGGIAAFSDIAIGTGKGKKLSVAKGNDQSSMFDFQVSETDQSGNRTMKSVKGTIVRNNPQVAYVQSSNSQGPVDNSARPALTNIFPGTSLDQANWNKSKSDSNLVDSGIDSFDSANNENEEAPGMFNRPNFGEISFLNRFNHFQGFPTTKDPIIDHSDTTVINGDGSGEERSSGETIPSEIVQDAEDLPWKDEDVEELDDDDDETEYTPVVMFLEGCGLTKYTHLFTKDDVDMEALMRLTNQDFEDMGLPIGPRRKVMDAIQRRRVVLSEPAQMYDSQL